MLVPIALILLCTKVNLGTSCCQEKERMISFLDAAVDLISKAKSENISCSGEHISERVLDCADLYRRGYNKSGVYSIWPNSRLASMRRLDVYCDMTTAGGGWTVIQKRDRAFKREENYFDMDWENYKKGFGNLEKDFWIGNDNIFALTNQRPYSVRFDLEDKEGNKAYALYDNFWTDDDYNNYTLHISGYSGTAGNGMVKHDKLKFTTKDRDNDGWSQGNCATKYKSGWWFSSCYDVNLNGAYNDKTNGINWATWKGLESLPKVEIKIRPALF